MRGHAFAAQLAVAPDAAQQMLAHHPAPLRRAGEPSRVCQAWHRTSEVPVLVPGMRGAAGEEQGKGVHREVGFGGSPIHTRGATNRNRIRGGAHPGRAGT